MGVAMTFPTPAPDCQQASLLTPPKLAYLGPRARWDWDEWQSRSGFLIEHDLFGKPVTTFPDHALINAPETPAMVPFFVQIKCKLGQSYVVANALAEAEIASEIYSTAGHYDLLVKFYVDKDTDIGHFINEKVQVLPGIQDTHTIITFKAFGAP
jgi:DNA-binding Lrp family transcriptional regulator